MPKEKIKIYENEVKEDIKFPELLDYERILYTPETLADINVTQGKKLDTAINDQGQVISDLINSKLNTQTKQILDGFTFGASGAIKIITDSNNGIWISPTGILGKKAGATTFALDNSGNATFSGTLSAASGTLGTITSATITAGTFQTATGGQRVIISGSNNSIKFYDNTGTFQGELYGSSSYGGIIAVNGNLGVTGFLDVTGNASIYKLYIDAGSGAGIEPSWNNSITLGSSSYRWNNVYSQNGNFAGTLVSQSLSVASDISGSNLYLSYFTLGGEEIKPTSGNLGYLGTASKYFFYAYVNNIRYKTIDTFQHHNDIALMKNIKAKKIKEKIPLSGHFFSKNGKQLKTKITEREVWDESTFPKEIVDGEFINGNAMIGFLMGTIKQLIDKMEKLEQKVDSKLK